MKTTIKDVAKYANVSPATVSFVLNNREGIKEETKQRILEAIEKLNYVPNQTARNLVSQKNNVIGLVVTNIDNPFYGELIMKVQKVLENTEYQLLLGNSNDKVEKEKKTIGYFIEKGLDGMLIVPSRDGENDLEHLYRLKQLEIPFVFITSAYHGIQADCVMTDLEQSMYEATKLLLERGERKIYFITDDAGLLLSSERIKGYKRAFEEKGIDYKNEWIVETIPEIENGITATETILQKEMPDAIVTVNSMVALGVMKLLRDYDIRVPQDISLICFDDLPYLSILYTPITSVKQSLEQISEKAVELLIDRMNGDKSSYKKEKLPATLLLRDSIKGTNVKN